MNIVYIHGFKSAGGGSKYDMLKSYFKDTEINIYAPTLPAQPSKAIGQLRSLIKGLKGPVIVVGTSLGGFYALYCASKLETVSFVINPSLEPVITLVSKIGAHTRYGGGDYVFKSEYIDELKTIFDDTYPVPGNNVHIYISNDDAILTYDKLNSYIPYRKTLKRFDDSGHRFSRFSEILPDIKEVVEELSTLQEMLNYGLHYDIL